MYGLSDFRNKNGNIPMRSAGILLFFLGLINLFSEVSRSVHPIISTSGIAYVICLLTGTLLILRVRSIVPFARFAVVAGFILQGGYLLMHGLFLDFMLQLVLCGGLWIVLSPRPDGFRIFYLGGVVMVSLILGVDVMVLTYRTGNRNSSIFSSTAGFNPATIDTVFGNAYTYRLDFGKPIWHIRDPKNYKESNPSADISLVDPKADAHLMVIGEHTKNGSPVDLNAFAAAVRYNLLKMNPGTELIGVSPLYGVYYDGIQLKLRSDIDGVSLEYLMGLYAIKNYAFQVIGYTHKREFNSIEPDLVDAIKSFYFDAAAQQKLDQLHTQQSFADKIK